MGPNMGIQGSGNVGSGHSALSHSLPTDRIFSAIKTIALTIPFAASYGLLIVAPN